MAITTRLSQELVDALEKHVGLQADALRIVLEQKTLNLLRGQLRHLGIVPKVGEVRSDFPPEVWALLDEVTRSRGEQMRLKTELAALREEMATIKGVKMMTPRAPRRPGILKTGKEPPKPPRQFILFACGQCEGLHTWADGTACGNSSKRYSSVNDYCMRTDVDARDVVVKTWKEYQDDIPF